MHKNINRREFVAISTAATAASAISPSAIAQPSLLDAESNQIPAPTLARVVASSTQPGQARIITRSPRSLLSHLPNSTTLSLEPLPCVEGRLDTDASITIELYHPTPNLYSILYGAHNITIPGKSIPAFGSSIQTQARSNSNSQISLRITQRWANRVQTNQLTIDDIGSYLLAIPTANSRSKPNFRFSSALLDESGSITHLNSPLPAASSRCAYFNITINDKSTGE